MPLIPAITLTVRMDVVKVKNKTMFKATCSESDSVGYGVTQEEAMEQLTNNVLLSLWSQDAVEFEIILKYEQSK